MFAVNAEDLYARVRVPFAPVKVLVFGQYVQVNAVTMLGLEHVIIWFRGGNVVKRNTELVAIA